MNTRRGLPALLSLLATTAALAAPGDPTPPSVLAPAITNGQKRIDFTPYPAADLYRMLSSPSANTPFTLDTNGTLSGASFLTAPTDPTRFYRLEVTPMSSNALLTATVLNRLAYGPTPDELERVTAMGPQAYINEQMAPELLTETMDDLVTTSANGTNWVYVTQTGFASSSSLYVYLSGAGESYIDDLKLVAGTVPEAGPNLLVNGDFEQPFVIGSVTNWVLTSTNASGSFIDGTIRRSGNGSLHLVFTSAGSSQSSAIWQTIPPGITNYLPYTLSYWYVPNTNRQLTIRLSGNGIMSTPDNTGPMLLQRLDNRRATMSDLRAWYCRRAVGANRQLLEVLSQFLENHFVTQFSKSRDYLGVYPSSTTRDILATDFEYREISKWRQALLNPDCTFHDLLRISAESPAMIIYLDTVGSKGNGSNIANENYARELLELFTHGVDNGYDQNDITVMSRAWTGWTINIVDEAQINNPFAPRSTNLVAGAPNNGTTNLIGVWSFVYNPTNHNNTQKVIFPGKTVPARFGPPWAGRNYELVLPVRTGSPNGGTNGIQDGYEAVAHLANQPFTQEYLSVKLCRWFIHDDFLHGTYNYPTDASAEAQLIHQCMLAWENSSPKGRIRDVLSVIFNSELFRRHGASMQKVKTPLEFAASTLRALRSANPNGSFTADTDGYAFSSPLSRMGTMLLFDRGDPDGYPEAAGGWISAGTLAERLRFAQSVLITHMPNGQSGKSDAGANNMTDPVALLQKKLPSNQWKDAGAVADYFLGILFPGEGRANLDLYRAAAINFLNTADNGTTASLFSGVASTGTPPTAYDTRVRGMVAMLMTFKRFQEQ